MTALTLGVPGRSEKENEQRLPIHPRHLDRIPAELRERVFLEHGYGHNFGVSDDDLAGFVAGFRSHGELVDQTDVLLLPKPTLLDVTRMRPGQVLWGWPHCVQDVELTQAAIDRRLTLIAWEAMNHWTAHGSFQVHVFHLNNELAGFGSVLHAMTLRGLTGHYGRHRRAVIIGFGNTARGAITALQSAGVHEIVALTTREIHAVAAPIPDVTLNHMERLPADPSRTRVLTDGGPVPTADYLTGFDIIVNCVMQDTDAPLMFVTTDEALRLRPDTIIVDVSCDAGMGFEFAQPTTFTDPMFGVARGVHYYGVDHSPSYLWESATWENSEALLPHLDAVLAGPSGWAASATIARAIEIRDGIVQNPRILTFQGRSPEFPHDFVER